MGWPPVLGALALARLDQLAGRTLTRDASIDQFWGPAFVGDRKTVDVHIHWLREKLMDQTPFEIVTVWRMGYRLDHRREQEAAG